MSDAAPTSAPLPLKRPRYRPGFITCGIVLLAMALLLLVRNVDFIGDIAIVNLLTLILGFIACCTLLVWFLLLSSYPGLLRVLTLVAILGSLTIFFVKYRIDGVSGEMIPRFVDRFSPPKDSTLGELQVTKQPDNPVDFTTTTPQDFGQFLGPDRNAYIAAPLLDRDWTAHPPKLLWKQEIGAGWSAFAAANGFAVTLEQRGDEELVTCYEVLTGKLRWLHSEPGRHSTVLGGIGPRSTPTIHNGRVYTVGAAGVVLCLEGATGNVLWRVDLLKETGSDLAKEEVEVAWGRSASPLIVDDLVVVPAGGPAGKYTSLIALKQDNGEIVWRGGNKQVSYASPMLFDLAGTRQIVLFNEDTISGHTPESGKLLWEMDYAGDSAGAATTSQPHLIGDNQLLLTKGYGVGAQLIRVMVDDTGKWSVTSQWVEPQVLKTKFTNAAVIGDYAYALSDGILECVEVATGKSMWKGKRRRLGDYGQGQLLGVGDCLLIQAENGDVALVAASPEKLNELGRFSAIEGQTWNNLCLYGPYLLVRNAEEAACYELKTRE